MTTVRESARPRSLVAVGLVLVAFTVLILLGNWQVRRLAWKQDLIAKVTDRTRADPLDLTGAGLASIDAEALLAANEYRPVTVDGQFSDQATIYVFTALSDPKGLLQGPGYWILTPLKTPSGRNVFVNRGFVPFDRLDETPPPPAGKVSVTGPLRSPERGNFATPDPDLPNRVWHVRNPAEIAAALLLEGDVMPFFIDADISFTPKTGIPQAGETRTVFVNSHLQYALTWYGLALALAGVFGVYVIKRQNSAAA